MRSIVATASSSAEYRTRHLVRQKPTARRRHALLMLAELVAMLGRLFAAVSVFDLIRGASYRIDLAICLSICAIFIKALFAMRVYGGGQLTGFLASPRLLATTFLIFFAAF